MSERNVNPVAGCLAVIISLLLLGLLVKYGNLVPKGAWQAQSSLDGAQCPDPAERIKAIDTIKNWTVEGNQFSGYQQLQEKGCRDPEPEVRVAALLALAEIAEQQPGLIAKQTLVGEAIYVDTSFLTTIGRTDRSSQVRGAVGKFWERADVLSEHGINALQMMLREEKEEHVVYILRECLARRIERSYRGKKVDATKAQQLRENNSLRQLDLKRE